jgi:hypothetical protein
LRADWALLLGDRVLVEQLLRLGDLGGRTTGGVADVIFVRPVVPSQLPAEIREHKRFGAELDALPLAAGILDVFNVFLVVLSLFARSS